MKNKYMVAAMCAAAVTMLAACGSDANTQSAQTSDSTQTSETKPEQTSGGETADTQNSAGDAASEDASIPAIDISGLKTATLKDVDVDKLNTFNCLISE